MCFLCRQSCGHITLEQAMAITRRGGKLRVELTGHKPGVVCHFDHFHQFTIHGATDNLQTGAFQLGQVIIVHFVAMTVTLDDAGAAVTLGRTAARLQNTFLTTQTHGATQIGFLGTLFLATVAPCGHLLWSTR